MKRIFIIFLVLVSLYVIATTAYQWLPLGSSASNGKVGSNIEEIAIELEGANATIQRTSGDDLETEIEGKGEVNVTEEGDTLKIKYERKFWFSSPFNRTATIVIHVPETFDRTLSIRGGSGTIDVNGENDWQLDEMDVKLGSGKINVQNILAETVSLEATSGVMSVDGIEAKVSDFSISSGKADINNVTAESVSLKASSGRIDGDSITADDIKANLSSGDFSLDNMTGGLTGELSSGRLTASFKEVTDDIDLRASSGRLQLDLPDDGDYTINGEYNSGHISANLPLENKSESDDGFTGKSGAGTHEVNVRVTSGSAEIN
ncbi:DUF4097 family beta strand repeat-containing protein [Cytobacillus gottheilii]|uniref:DUF4097 family beta strand repeat protein n=1 Tax=Cytobacillus gottheilii TaxID=859144 RepID=A0ABX8F9E4_9BACI|nr:DUF4097 family beta strand repeat-containing protein [Cytobacillus gottheilii]QVY61038.1 DUF4097 family beta strand repeat protein [Cytobacillus gottheilii]